LQRVTKQVPSALDRAEQISNGRKRSSPQSRKVERRASGRANPALNGRRLQVWVDFLRDFHKLIRAAEIIETLAEIAVTHQSVPTTVRLVALKIPVSARHELACYPA
jgi:hypothetical protein